MLAMTLIQGVTIVVNFMGDGMNNYTSSFSTYLIKTTVGMYGPMKPITRETQAPLSLPTIRCLWQVYLLSTS